MKKVYIILMLILSAAAFKTKAQVKVVGAIQPNGTADTYPTHYDIYSNGGFRSVADLAERDAIFPLRRKEGMLVYVAADKTFYQLRDTDPATIAATIDNSKWVPVTLGGGSGSTGGGIISGPGDPATNPPANPQPGDYYLDTSTNILYGPYNSVTNTWPQVGSGSVGSGATGPKGADGNTILSGAGAPDINLGVNGDFYIDTTQPTPQIYGPKQTNNWGLATGLASGPQGLPGPAGGTILKGTGQPSDTNLGSNGDYYIDATSKDLYGPKTGGAWGAPAFNLGNGAPGVGIDYKGSFTQAEWNAAFPTPTLNLAYYNEDQKQSLIYNGTAWQILAKDGATGTGGGGADGVDWTLFANKAMTTTPFNSFNPGPITNLQEFIQSVFYPSQSGSAGLSVEAPIYREVPGPTTAAVNFTWTASQQGTSANIKTVVITGNGTTLPVFAGNSAGPLTGVISPTVPTDKSTTFTSTVTTMDDKKSTAQAAVHYQWKRYWGFVDAAATGIANGLQFSPSDTDIKGLSQELASGNVPTGLKKPLSNPSSPQRVVVAVPEIWGDIVILSGATPITSSFNKELRSFINESGGTTNYIIYTASADTNLGYEITIQ